MAESVAVVAVTAACAMVVATGGVILAGVAVKVVVVAAMLVEVACRGMCARRWSSPRPG